MSDMRNNKISLKTILLALLLSVLIPASAQPAWDAPDDLLEMVEQMRTNFPKLKELNQLEHNFEFRRNLARGALFPIIGAEFDYYYLAPVNEFSVAGESVKIMANHNYSAQIYATHPIWDFGKTRATIDKVDNEQHQMLHTKEFTELNLAYQLTNIYYGILFLEKSMAIQEAEMEAALESERITALRFKSGEALELDLFNTQVRIEQIKNRKTDIQSQIDKQRKLLRYITGNDYANFTVGVETSFPGADAFGGEMADPAFKGNVDVVNAEDKWRLAKNDLEINSKMAYPTLSLKASGGMKNGFIPDLNTPKANIYAGAGISFPFFAGFRFRSMTRISKNMVVVAELGLESAMAEARKNYEQAVEDLVAAEEKLQRMGSLITTAEKALKITNSRFNNGLITSYEMILAQNNLENARMAQVQLEYQRWQALLEINKVLGTRFWE
jgi:outer membrane protein